MKAALLLLLAGAAAQAGGLDPKPAPADYPIHVQLPDGGALGIAYHGRGLPASQGGVFLGSHLALEIAYYPPKGEKSALHAGHFALRIGKMKPGIPPEPPGMVAASLKYADWEGPRGLQAEGGIGPIVVRPRTPTPRYPGGPPQQPPRRPGVQSEEQADPQEREAQAVLEFAFPEGETRQPAAGYLYFRWGKRLKDIKTLTLDFSGPGGPSAIKIPLD